MALRGNRRLIRAVYEKIAKISTHECKVLIDTGVDAIWPSGDITYRSGPMVNPKDSREFFFPWLHKVS